MVQYRHQFHKAAYFVTSFAFCLLPFISTIVQSIIAKCNLFRGIPHNGDEFCYWRILYSFSKYGMDFANSCGEVGTKAAIGPLGEHGVATLLAWMPLLGIGLSDNSIFIYNIFVLSLALFIFFCIVKPSIGTMLLIALTIVGNGVVVEQWNSHMMELPCLALIIIIVSYEIKYENTDKDYLLPLIALHVLYLSFMRICYVILLFPVITIYEKKQKDNIKKVGLWFTYFILAYACRKTQLLFMKRHASVLAEYNSNGIVVLYDNLKENIMLYFNLYNGSRVEVGQRYFQTFLIALFLITGGIYIKVFKKLDGYRFLYHAIELLGLVFSVMLLYDCYDWRDVRTTMPLFIGMTIWYIMQLEYILSCNKKIFAALVSIFVGGCAVFLFVFAFTQYCDNHPEDRYISVENYKEEWMSMIPNEKEIICIEVPMNNLYGIYRYIPPKVGILLSRGNIDENVSNDIDFLVTKRVVSSLKYEYITHSEVYGNVYRVIHN